MDTYKELPINIKIRLVGSFFSRISSSAILPFIALYLTEKTNTSFTGIYLSLVVVLNFFVNILSGYICDRVSRKKMLVIISVGESLSLFGLTLSVIFNDKNIFLIMFIIYMIMVSSKRPVLTALIQDSVSIENKKIIYRLDYWFINLSMALGAVLGGGLYNTYKVALFLGLFITTVCLTIVYFLFLEDTHMNNEAKDSKKIIFDFTSNYLEVFKNKRYICLLIGWMCIFTAEFSVSGYIAIRLMSTFQTINVSGILIDGVRVFSIINLLNTIIIVLFTMKIGKMMEKFSINNVLLIGLIIYSIGYIFLTSANELWFIVLFSIIVAFGELIYAPVLNTAELDLIPAQKRGVYSSVSSLKNTGADLLSKIGIIVGAMVSPIAMSFIMAVLVFVGSAFIIVSLYFKTNENS
jgi:Na+/melibiose symporter and related transporters